MKCRNLLFLLCFLMLLLMGGCGKQDTSTVSKDRYSIYYLNREETKISEFAYYTETKEPMKVLSELLQAANGYA